MNIRLYSTAALNQGRGFSTARQVLSLHFDPSFVSSDLLPSPSLSLALSCRSSNGPTTPIDPSTTSSSSVSSRSRLDSSRSSSMEGERTRLVPPFLFFPLLSIYLEPLFSWRGHLIPTLLYLSHLLSVLSRSRRSRGCVSTRCLFLSSFFVSFLSFFLLFSACQPLHPPSSNFSRSIHRECCSSILSRTKGRELASVNFNFLLRSLCSESIYNRPSG